MNRIWNRPWAHDDISCFLCESFVADYLRSRRPPPAAPPSPARSASPVEKPRWSVAPEPVRHKRCGRPGRPGETPKEAAARRKREAADREAERHKAAAKESMHNKTAPRRRGVGGPGGACGAIAIEGGVLVAQRGREADA